MTALHIRGLQADYGGQPVLRDIQFDLEPGDYACLLGRSGSGKSTLLAAVAGFVRPHAGQIAIDGETVCDPTQSIDRPPHQRGLGMVFQDANLWPHLGVMDMCPSSAWPIWRSRSPTHCAMPRVVCSKFRSG